VDPGATAIASIIDRRRFPTAASVPGPDVSKETPGTNLVTTVKSQASIGDPQDCLGPAIQA